MIRNEDIRRLNRLTLELVDQLLEERPGIWVGHLLNWSSKLPEAVAGRDELVERLRSRVAYRKCLGTGYQDLRIDGRMVDADGALVPADEDDRWRPASRPMIARLLGAKVPSTILLLQRRYRQRHSGIPLPDAGAPRATGVPGGGGQETL